MYAGLYHFCLISAFLIDLSSVVGGGQVDEIGVVDPSSTQTF